jgi:hypothetical protein
VNIISQQLDNNSLGFFAEIDGRGTFTIELQFNHVENATVEPKRLFTVEGNGQFFVLSPIDASKPVEADFYYNWLQGEVDPKVQADFVYRLPFNAGASSTPKRLANYDVGMMRGNFVDFTMWEFPLAQDGTIFAARAGEVIEIEGFYPAAEGAEEDEYADRGCEIYVEHADGTIACYAILENSSLQVALGDPVYPDTPIAKVGEIEEGQYALRFCLYYYATNQSQMNSNMFSQKHYLNPVFSTEFGDIRLGDVQVDAVTAQADKELIKAEKPKRSFWQRLFGGKN